MSELVPEYDPDKVLVGLARMFLQPYDSETPAALPANTVALGGAWSSPWTAVGATMDGLSLDVKRTTQEIMIEEQPNPVDTRTKSMTFDANFEMSEDDLRHMLWAYGGGEIVTVAAGVGTVGTSKLTIGEEMSDFAFGFEGQNELGFWRRVLLQPVKSVGNAKTQYRRSSSQRTYAVQLSYLGRIKDVTILNMDAPASA